MILEELFITTHSLTQLWIETPVMLVNPAGTYVGSVVVKSNYDKLIMLSAPS